MGASAGSVRGAKTCSKVIEVDGSDDDNSHRQSRKAVVKARSKFLEISSSDGDDDEEDEDEDEEYEEDENK